MVVRRVIWRVPRVQSTRYLLSMTFLPLIAAALMSCSGGSPEPETPVTPQPAAQRRPNVLIVLWDTVRADRLSLYGHDRQTTPAMAKWAAGGTVYEQAWSPGTWTVPAHASIFTGLPTSTHGAHGDHRWLDDCHQTLAELLAADGYDTVAFSANLYVGSVANLLQGFETVHTTYPRKGLKRGRYVQASLEATTNKILAEDGSTEISPKFRGNGAEKWDKSAYKDAAGVLAQGLVEYLDEREGDAPWLAYLNFMEAHTPRIPSEASRKALLDEAARTRALQTDMSLFAENSWMVGQREYADAELAAFSNVYDAALLDMDQATAWLFDELGRRGQLQDTVVIFVSDHGESLGEHRMLEHRWAIHEPLLHVPFVIHYPRGGFGPARHTEPVSTLDLFATVLDLAHVDPPKVAGLYSTSLDNPHRDQIYSQLVHAYAGQLRPIHRAYPSLDLSQWKRTYQTIRRGEYKLIRPSEGPVELYDLGSDPGELTDLAPTDPTRARELDAALQSWLDDRPPPRNCDPGEAELSPEEEAQLRILGYLDDEEDE